MRDRPDKRRQRINRLCIVAIVLVLVLIAVTLWPQLAQPLTVTAAVATFLVPMLRSQD